MAKEQQIDLSLGDSLPLGSRIRLRRQFRGVRLTQMATDLEYDKSYFSHMEHNRSLPSDGLLEKIAGYLVTTVAVLREGPIIQLTDGLSHEQFVTKTSSLGRRMEYPPRPRSGVQRIHRILAMGHLTELEETAIMEELVKNAQSLVFMVRSLHQTPEN